MMTNEHLILRLCDFAQAHPWAMLFMVYVAIARPFGVLINLWLNREVRKQVAGQQLWDLHEAHGTFWWINLIVHTVTSISLIQVNAYLQVLAMGDSDTTIKLPYQTMTTAPVPDHHQEPERLEARGVIVQKDVIQ
jgi:hypothetical protein